MECYQNAGHVARSLAPFNPVICARPAAATRAARWFATRFPGKTFYAVKANPAPWMIAALGAGGIDHFDVASIREARLVRALVPEATIGFMHPVKAPEAIAEAYHCLGISIFSLDSCEELDKIVAATGGARDLTLCVRLSVPGHLSKISLAAKFGVAGEEAIALMGRTRQVAARLGACFHVGSQAMSPAAYRMALEVVQRTVVASGVILDVIDIGGGFPSVYPGMTPPPLEQYVFEIEHCFETTMLVPESCELWCEPGRALAAEAASLIVRVEHRSGGRLHVNDGVFGALYDAGTLGWPYPVCHLGGNGTQPLAPFSLYGPTCDDADVVKGPFLLPETIAAGDHIEIDMLGAYGASMRTDFNGFATHETVEVADMAAATQFAADGFAAISLA